MKKMYILLMIIFLVFIVTGCKKKVLDRDVKEFNVLDTLESVEGLNRSANIVLLYGQSNATGISRVSYLKEKDLEYYNNFNTINNCYINYYVDNGINTSNNSFIKIKFGCGYNEEYFGPEIGICKILSEELDNVFVIKCTYSGTSLNYEWLNGKGERGTLYKEAVNFTKANIDYLVKKGYEINIKGICFMQGENDAISNPGKYHDDLKAFINYFREDLKDYYTLKLPFIDAYISDNWLNYKKVNTAKLNISNEMNDCYIVDSIKLGLEYKNEPTEDPDKAHFDSLSEVKLGENFGKKLLEIWQD